jgi:hypothetical protein
LDEINHDDFFGRLRDSANVELAPKCEICNSQAKLTTKILAQAKISIAKHLKNTNERETLKLDKKVERLPKDKPIAADRVIAKLAKAKLKLDHVLNPKR